MTIDPERFVASLRWNAAMLEYEYAIMQHIPHICINFETDLKDASQRDPTIRRICSALGLEYSTPVKATLKPTGGKFGPQIVENMDDILAHVQDKGLGHHIPKNLLQKS